jgi:hypothetical protein
VVYKVVVRLDRRTECFYWNGILEETIDLARKVASEYKAVSFSIGRFRANGHEIFSENAPFLDESQRPLLQD